MPPRFGNRRYPCGYRNDPRRDCHCTPPQIERYMGKISGPLLDRIDIQLEVPAVPFQELSTERAGTSSQMMREQVSAARAMQKKRFARTRTLTNSQMNARQVREFCKLTDDCLNLMREAVQSMGLSARAHDKILRVARTIADLDSAESIGADHLTEAINYRMLDRQMFS